MTPPPKIPDTWKVLLESDCLPVKNGWGCFQGSKYPDTQWKGDFYFFLEKSAICFRKLETSIYFVAAFAPSGIPIWALFSPKMELEAIILMLILFLCCLSEQVAHGRFPQPEGRRSSRVYLQEVIKGPGVAASYRSRWHPLRGQWKETQRQKGPEATVKGRQVSKDGQQKDRRRHLNDTVYYNTGYHFTSMLSQSSPLKTWLGYIRTKHQLFLNQLTALWQCIFQIIQKLSVWAFSKKKKKKSVIDQFI